MIDWILWILAWWLGLTVYASFGFGIGRVIYLHCPPWWALTEFRIKRLGKANEEMKRHDSALERLKKLKLECGTDVEIKLAALEVIASKPSGWITRLLLHWALFN